jgi:hypothetical protein
MSLYFTKNSWINHKSMNLSEKFCLLLSSLIFVWFLQKNNKIFDFCQSESYLGSATILVIKSSITNTLFWFSQFLHIKYYFKNCFDNFWPSDPKTIIHLLSDAVELKDPKVIVALLRQIHEAMQKKKSLSWVERVRVVAKKIKSTAKER